MKIKYNHRIYAGFLIFLFMCCVIRLLPEIGFLYNKNKNEYEKINLAYEEVLEKLESKEGFMEMETALIKDREKMAASADIRQENVIAAINRCLSSCSITFTKISFGEVVPVVDTAYEEGMETENNNENPEIVVMKAVVEFNSSYEKMLEFVSLLEKGTLELSVDCINAVLSDEGMVSAGITVNFYGVRE